MIELVDADLEKLDEVQLKNLALNCYSCLKEDGKKVNYFTYISSKKNEDGNKALKEIVGKIDMNKINSMIDEIDCISDIRKNFYKKMLAKRFKILAEMV